ncbi:MAG: hypothetical protein HYS43_01665 [Candidatus Liptonbacteria bacterium]|nr:hypothetical protein [Candidatus Liptonbacteria bacterium]
MFYKTAAEFLEENGYTFDIGGTQRWYPRVTKIIGIKAKPALYQFYGSMESYQHGERVKELSAAEGTQIHEVAQAILLGENPDVPPSIAPAIAAFRQFLETTRVETKPEFVERRIVHPVHRYAGTVDVLADIGGKFGVLDIKTSQSIYRDYNLQTSAYVDSLKDEFPRLSTQWILRIDQHQKCGICNATRRTKGGREKVRRAWPSNGTAHCADESHEWLEPEGVVEMKEFPYWRNDFEAFLAAKKLWEWENGYWLRQVGYL